MLCSVNIHYYKNTNKTNPDINQEANSNPKITKLMILFRLIMNITIEIRANQQYYTI